MIAVNHLGELKKKQHIFFVVEMIVTSLKLSKTLLRMRTTIVAFNNFGNFLV